MQHEFTNQQLDNAMGVSYEVTGDEDILEVSFEGIRAFLDALPEPQDEWEQCTIDQIRKGDRFKVEGRGWHYESTATHIYVDVVCVNPRTGSFIIRDEVDQIDEITLYRIPAPAQHPDPEQHPVIYVKECDIVNFIPKIMVWHRDSYVAGQQCLPPERITDWQQIDPAKVVADDD